MLKLPPNYPHISNGRGPDYYRDYSQDIHFTEDEMVTELRHLGDLKILTEAEIL
jgi:hypothetical protein